MTQSRVFDINRQSSCLPFTGRSVRQSLPSIVSKSNAKKNGLPRWNSKSRNCGFPFADLGKHTATSVPDTKLTVLDGEIVCVDKKGDNAIPMAAERAKMGPDCCIHF
jgi:hypothetical protein